MLTVSVSWGNECWGRVALGISEGILIDMCVDAFGVTIKVCSNKIMYTRSSILHDAFRMGVFCTLRGRKCTVEVRYANASLVHRLFSQLFPLQKGCNGSLPFYLPGTRYMSPRLLGMLLHYFKKNTYIIKKSILECTFLKFLRLTQF